MQTKLTKKYINKKIDQALNNTLDIEVYKYIKSIMPKEILKNKDKDEIKKLTLLIFDNYNKVSY